MEKDQNINNLECNTPRSERFRIQSEYKLFCSIPVGVMKMSYKITNIN
jgi:hypothetical protein